MPCNCKVKESSASTEHQNGCEMNAHRSSSAQNGHHNPHRKLFQDTVHEEVKDNAVEAEDRDAVRL